MIHSIDIVSIIYCIIRYRIFDDVRATCNEIIPAKARYRLVCAPAFLFAAAIPLNVLVCYPVPPTPVEIYFTTYN